MPRSVSPIRREWMDPAVCSLEYRLKIISRLPFFRHLPSQEIEKINRLFEDCDIAAEQGIYYEGDPAENLYLVAMGKVKLMRHTASGRDVLLDILRGGEYFGNLSATSHRGYMETAIAQTDGCILRIPFQNFEKILQHHPDVMMKVLKAVGKRLEEFQEVIKQLSVYTADQRIAAALIRLVEKVGEQRSTGTLIQVPFSRQDLAGLTGTTTETVSRVMSRFAADGLIRTGRKWVVVKDLEHLREIVKEAAFN